MPDLSRLDGELSAAYAAARSEGSDTAALAEGQHAWLRQRNACGANAQCLRESMSARLAELQRWPGAAGGAERPVAAQAAQNAAASQTSPSEATPPQAEAAASPSPLTTEPSADPLASLVHPPAGLRSWPLDTIDGHLVVSFHNDHRPVQDVDLGSRFFHLLALATLPGAIENEKDVGFLGSLLDESALRTAFGTQFPNWNQWGGHNELEQAQSRRTFLHLYAPSIRAMAPKPPFVLHWTEPVMLGQYDDAQGGFAVHPSGGPGPDMRDQLLLLQCLGAGGLVPAPGFTWPDLFWKVDPAKAEDVLRRWPERILEFQVAVEIGAIDPVSKEVALKLDGLSLHAPRHGAVLHTYLAAPEPPRMLSAAAPGRTAVASASAPANDAEALRHWNLPVRAGLPWIDAQNDLSLQVGWPSDFQTFELHPHGLTPHELWSRAIHALALANTPDAALGDDADMAHLACIFLPTAAQTQMFQQDSCNFQPGRPGAPFQLKDGAAAFRSRELPRIRAQAPHLPLTLLLVLPVQLSNYDATRGGFEVHEELGSRSGPELLFGSPLDVLFPDFWHATEAEARRYSATQTSAFVSKAWLGMTVTLTGTTPGQGSASIRAGNTGLPNHGGWRFHTDTAILYLDSGLHTALHDFTPELGRLPQPILGTAEEQTPHASGPMIFGGEAVLLELLHHSPQLPAGISVDWTKAAQERFTFEQGLRDRPDWHDFDAWGVFFPWGFSPPEQSDPTVDRYRAWTLRRAAALPDSVVTWRTLDPWPISNSQLRQLPVLGLSNRYLDQNFSMPAPDVLRQLAASGITAAQVVPLQLRWPGSGSVPVYAAVPQPVQNYLMQTEVAVPAPGPNEKQPTLAVRSTIAGLDILHLDNDTNRPVLILPLVPAKAEVRRGSQVLAASALTGPDWAGAAAAQRTTAQARAEQNAAEAKAQNNAAKAAAAASEASVRQVAANALAGVPYGPEVVGLRLGMTMAEVEKVIRHDMTIGMILEGTSGNNGTGTHHLGPVRIFISADGKEQIVLLDRSSGKVLGIQRFVAVDEGLSDAQLLESLRNKYGPPLVSGNGAWKWGKSDAWPCAVRSTMISQLKPLEGAPPSDGVLYPGTVLLDRTVGFITPWAYSNVPAPAFTQTAGCDARLEVWRGKQGLTESVYDVRIYATQEADAKAEAASKASVPKL